MSDKPRDKNKEALPGFLYQPISCSRAPALLTGWPAQARRIAKKKRVPLYKALVDFPAGRNLMPLQKIVVDGREIYLPKGVL